MKRQVLQTKKDDALLNELASEGDPTESGEQRMMKELGITGEPWGTTSSVTHCSPPT